MKKILSIISLIFALSTTIISANNNEVKVVLDGETLNFDVPAQIIDGRTMVPMRAIFEKLGAEVEWNAELSQVNARKPGVIIALRIGKTTAYRNTVAQTIDVPPQIINDRTLVPVRVVSEYMGASVSWEQETQTVYITSTNKIQYIDWNDNYYYFGEVIDDDANGYGIFYSKEDDSIFQIGKYVDSQITEGTTLFSNGGSYSGEYKDGMMHGKGVSYYPDGSRYAGGYKDGKHHGEGVFISADGSSYTGEYQNGLLHGQGTEYHADGSSYIGEYQNGLYHGVGTFYSSSDNYFDGTWKNGLLHGSVTFFYSQTGYKIIGNYTDNKRNGEFITYDANGNIIDVKTYINDEEVVAIPIPNTPISTSSDYEAELQELNEWYDKEAAEIEEFANSDPLETSWGKKQMEFFEKQANESYDNTIERLSKMSGGYSNTNSLSIVESQKEAYLKDCELTVLKMFQNEVDFRWENLQSEYEQKLYRLQTKYGY